MKDTLLDRLEADAPALFRTRWWALALRGLIGIIFGVLALATPVAALLSLVLVFGIFSVADGIAGIISAWGKARSGERWVLYAIGAVASIVIGVIAFLKPPVAALALLLLIGANAAVSGVIFIATGFRLQGEDGRWWLVAAGVASLVFAALIVAQPLASAVAITWVIGAWAIVTGVFLIILGFRLRTAREKIRARLSQVRDQLQPPQP
jgi:uncharacterized membrane protein HdeD (DUF308 family)